MSDVRFMEGFGEPSSASPTDVPKGILSPYTLDMTCANAFMSTPALVARAAASPSAST